VVKLVEARNAQAGAFRKAMLSLTCRDGSTVRLQYIREVGAEPESLAGGLRVRAGQRSFPLMRLASAVQGGDRPRVENYGAELPLAVLDTAAFVVDTDASSGPGSDSPSKPSPLLTAQAAGSALGALVRRCRADVH
jgi:hypothetical protein